METLLHVEPLVRHIDAPIRIGSTDYVFFGNQEAADGEHVGHRLSNVRLGSPLATVDPDSVKNRVSLVKTVGIMPGYFTKGDIVTETVHYLDDSNLIPIRTKFRSGMGEGLCVSHLPSLNLARRRLTGDWGSRVVDPRSDIVQALLDHSQMNRAGVRPWARDWVQDEMLPKLMGIHHTASTLAVDPVERMIDNYIGELADAPNEMSINNAKDMWRAMVPEQVHIPANYHFSDPIHVPLSTVRRNLRNNPYDFRSWGSIQLGQFPQVVTNPQGFQTYAEWFDDLHLTDFNVDMVLTVEGQVVFFHCHLAVNRFDALRGALSSTTHNALFLEEEFDEDFLQRFLERYVKAHPLINDHLKEWINSEPIKLKFVKTMGEEAAILLYQAYGKGDEPPVTGIKFDLGLQFLAPMSVMEEPI